jgi:radical SAM superfamily enzyme YgiQ (UPF0313 family)
MQPLAIAALSSLTPKSWGRTFFDDRLEPIDFDLPTDLVAISIETFTACRGYQIAAEYKKRGVPVVMGGYHATFCPDEVLQHADAVCVGEAEGVWATILGDLQKGTLNGKYEHAEEGSAFTGFDRSIFAGKNYFKIELVETGRGCHSKCSFCSITAFHKGNCLHRPIGEVIEEIRGLSEKTVFIVDDNVVGNLKRARELFVALADLDIKWVGQASINIASDSELLDLMAQSGCAGLLIGFESLNQDSLACVNKKVNQDVDYAVALSALRKRGIVVYGTFLIGLPDDTVATMEQSTAFAIDERIFIAAFNHIVPFPGTPLYNDLDARGRLTYPAWWLSADYRFGDAPYSPECASADVLKEWCHTARRRFYNFPSILKRSMDFRANCGSMRKLGLYFTLNFLLRREISQKRGLPLGVRD